MPPFKSKAQQKFLYAKHPKIAEEFAAHTKDYKKLPEHMKKSPSKKVKRGGKRAK